MPDDPRNTRRRVRLTIGLAVIAALCLFAWFGPTAVRQARWMAEAKHHLPAVEQVIQADARFAKCRAAVSTGGGFVVVGQVSAEDHLLALKEKLEPIKVPGGTAFLVRVD